MHAKFNELELNQLQFSFSVICIHECWLQENYEMSQLTLTNYNYTATGRRCSNKAGLLICAHNNTITNPHQNDKWECQLAKPTGGDLKKGILEVKVYRSPNDLSVQYRQFIGEFANLLISLDKYP